MFAMGETEWGGGQRLGEDSRTEKGTATMPIAELTTTDLLLRPWEREDAEALYRACQDPDIQRWTTVPTPYRLDDARAFLDASLAAWRDGSGAPMGVFDQATGELLGSCALSGIRDGSAQVGYWTAPWARGRGVALRAVRALALFGFGRLDLRRLLWQAEIGNHASRLVAQRAGFRINGEWRYVQPHPRGRAEAWVGTLLPGEVSAETPSEYATGSLAARRAAVFGASQPVLPLAGGNGRVDDLVTGRLRPLCPADLPGVTAACRDAESARWTTVPVPYTEDSARQFVFDHMPGQWARGHGAVFAIADEHDAYLGSIDLVIDPADGECAEVGYLVAPWARGRGYASGALRTLCSWGFSALGLARIVWRAHVGNGASRRVAEKAGFTVEGIQRAGCAQRGQRHDAWVGSLLAPAT
jgi:RimJ/RimL family protein N-acetyltransferase